MPYVVIIE